MPECKMLINYVPGEECRVAIVEDGKLEEYYAERMSAVSRVGNIYVGRVTNVEPAIQAAFVDFGVGENGFLHVSDLHPRYFPGEDDETTERVGKKTPRRERPPIQAAIKKGMEIAVQVIKEGVGTKGPTLTSYLSIPGRFLVMMPQMDKVGVSRKVEDEEKRAQMRKILDQLELPEGFGFIVRTAGMERNKTELKRDLAYLARLWKDMERRRKSGNRPRLLYSESDLLVRSLRDLHTTEINEIVIDNELALKRASQFLKIVAPRGGAKLRHYKGMTPIYHAFGVEQQIAMMHSSEVPLASGGRLVIDETEALIAIDVNSGRMRDARDAETTAYRTNIEAVDEICRQIRLRDVGGLIINDLIDMRDLKRRRDIEQRFKERLKRDRARTTVLQISAFGILEMTRQRNRGSHESQHFAECPTCHGRGLIQRPGSVAADALRELAAIIDHDRIAKVEMVVSPRIAGELLSSRRRALSRVERTSGKHVEVRVSEAVPLDRVTFYAYEENGADVEVAALQHVKKNPAIEDWMDESPIAGEVDVWDDESELAAETADQDYEPTAMELEGPGSEPVEPEGDDGPSDGPEGEGRGLKKGRRRRRRGGRGRSGEGAGEPGERASQPAERGGRAPASRSQAQGQSPAHSRPEPDAEGDHDGHADQNEQAPDGHEHGAGQNGEEHRDGAAGGKKRRRRRRGGKGRSRAGAEQGAPVGDNGTAEHHAHDGSHDADDGEGQDQERRADAQPHRGRQAHPDGQAAEHAGDGQSDGGHDDGGPEDGPDGGPESGEGGPRRKRRRRRGRGRGRGAQNGAESGAENGADGGGAAPSAARAQAAQGSNATGGGRDGGGGGRSGGGRGSGGSQARSSDRGPARESSNRESGGRESQRSASGTSSAAAPGPSASPAAGAPKPRTLYATRRKLSPSERRALGPE